MEINKNTMTSLEIAEVSGKMHKHVLEAIRTMEPAWKKVNGTNFRLVEYTDAKGEKRPCFELTKTECLFIATKFNDEARARLVLRWEKLELEKQHELPKTFSEALMLAAKQAEEIEFKEKQLKEQAPKVLFADSVTGSSNSILVRQFAKDLCDEGFEIGQNRLFKWFRDNGYLNQNNEPYQEYINQQLFEVITRAIGSGDETFTTKTTKITGRGAVYFAAKIKNT